MSFDQHPLSEVFPSMSADEYVALVDDITVNGQRQPVTLFEGKILDGWHRASACRELGMTLATCELEVGADPIAFVISQNLKRRHLDASQRAAAVVACHQWAPAYRPKKDAPGATFSTNGELAKAAKVSKTTIAHAKVAHKAGLAAQVKSGEMTAKEAARVAKRRHAATAGSESVAPADPGMSAEEIALARADEQQMAIRLRVANAAEDLKLQEALVEVDRLTCLNVQLTARIDDLLITKNEYLRHIRSLELRLEKAEKP